MYDNQTPTLRLLTTPGAQRVSRWRVVGYALLVGVIVVMLTPGFLR